MCRPHRERNCDMGKTSRDKQQIGFSKTWLFVVFVFGAAAFLVRWAGLAIPVIGPAAIDPREVFVTLGAASTGPVGGLVIKLKFSSTCYQRVSYRTPVQAALQTLVCACAVARLGCAGCCLLLCLPHPYLPRGSTTDLSWGSIRRIRCKPAIFPGIHPAGASCLS